MGQKERAIIDRILLNLPKNQRLFRINSGMGWTGKIINRKDKVIVLENYRPLHAGPTGWPDLCGWETVTITPDMIGQKIAVFKGIEVKTGKQKLRDVQSNIKDLITEMGGIFIVQTDNE